MSDTAVLEKETLQYVKIDDNHLNVKKWSEDETEIERFSAWENSDAVKMINDY